MKILNTFDLTKWVEYFGAPLRVPLATTYLACDESEKEGVWRLYAYSTEPFECKGGYTVEDSSDCLSLIAEVKFELLPITSTKQKV